MARDTIVIRKPARDAKLRLVSRNEVTVDMSLARPWFDAPSYGTRIRTITGQSRRGVDFQLSGERSITSLTEGRAATFDTHKDSYSRTDSVGAGLGCYVVVASGDLKLIYANLKRGSARSGEVRVGDRIGLAGNTGHCLEGDGKHFVHFEVNEGTTPREPAAFAQPLEVALLIAGRAVGKPVEVPKGILQVAGFAVGELSISPHDFQPGSYELEVLLKHGVRVRASAKQRVDIIR